MKKLRKYERDLQFRGVLADKRDEHLKTQAHRIIEKFGGAPELRRALLAYDPTLRIAESTIRRWDYPLGRSSGLGGMIPMRWKSIIMKAARLNGIYIDERDFYALRTD